MATATRDGTTSEWMQIVMLTLPMTGGLFLICYLVCALYLVPSKKEEVSREQKRYEELTALLSSDKMRLLRQQSKAEAETNNQRGLGQLIEEHRKMLGLTFDRIPPSKSKEIRPGYFEVSQKVTTEPAPMSKLIQFAIAVSEAKKTIQLERFNLNRGGRGAARDDDLWKADIYFVDYVSKS